HAEHHQPRSRVKPSIEPGPAEEADEHGAAEEQPDITEARRLNEHAARAAFALTRAANGLGSDLVLLSGFLVDGGLLVVNAVTKRGPSLAQARPALQPLFIRRYSGGARTFWARRVDPGSARRVEKDGAHALGQIRDLGQQAAQIVGARRLERAADVAAG